MENNLIKDQNLNTQKYIDKIISLYDDNLNIANAIDLAVYAHTGQKRVSGDHYEPYHQTSLQKASEFSSFFLLC